MVNVHIFSNYNNKMVGFMVLNTTFNNISAISKRIGGVMVSVLASSVVNGAFEPRSGQTKGYQIGICCFSAKHAELRRKSKD